MVDLLTKGHEAGDDQVDIGLIAMIGDSKGSVSRYLEPPGQLSRSEFSIAK
jgi:hypothetical protein